MNKYILGLVASVFFMLSGLQVQASNGITPEQIKELVFGAKKHTDDCVTACRDYYNANKNLQGFSFANNFRTKALGYFLDKGIEFLGGRKAHVTSEYCKAAQESLAQCYKQDSALYSICKLGAQNIAGWITADPNWKDYFASCKDTCFKDLKAFCE